MKFAAAFILWFAANLPLAGQAGGFQPADRLTITLKLHDLLSTDNSRFTAYAVSGGKRQQVIASSVNLDLNPISVEGIEKLNSRYFQFEILDQGNPIRSYNVFIGATVKSCPIVKGSVSGVSITEVGREFEVYTLIAIPETQFVPQRSEVHRFCSTSYNHIGLEVFSPTSDPFAVDVTAYNTSGVPFGSFPLYVPGSFSWSPK